MRLTMAVLAVCLASSDAFYTFLKPNVYSCFTEELPASRVLLHIDYTTGDAISEGDIGLEVISPRGQTIHTATLERKQGAIQVSAKGLEGPHSICLLKKGAKPVRVDLRVEAHTVTTGDWVEHKDPSSGRFFYHNPKSKESVWQLPPEITQKLSVKNVQTQSGKDTQLAATQAEMELYANYMKALQAMMDQIHDESEEIVERQMQFKSTSDSTATALFYLSVMQVCMCVAIPALQSFQLKRLFVSKKFV